MRRNTCRPWIFEGCNIVGQVSLLCLSSLYQLKHGRSIDMTSSEPDNSIPRQSTPGHGIVCHTAPTIRPCAQVALVVCLHKADNWDEPGNAQDKQKQDERVATVEESY